MWWFSVAAALQPHDAGAQATSDRPIGYVASAVMNHEAQRGVCHASLAMTPALGAQQS
jgi:hypothetical protein